MAKTKIENTVLKYLYRVFTWGGFYNKEYQVIHKQEPGERFFDTKKEAEHYLSELKKTEKKLKANYLVSDTSEGYCCHIPTVLHRVVEWEGKRYYSSYEIDLDFPYESAKYHMEWKWYPGFNDYPLGEDFDYENNKVKIIQEWITGAFDIKDE